MSLKLTVRNSCHVSVTVRHGWVSDRLPGCRGGNPRVTSPVFTALSRGPRAFGARSPRRFCPHASPDDGRVQRLQRVRSAPSGTLLTAIDMGYGHLRAAHALGSALELPVLCVDEPPLADIEEQRLWARARRLYEFVSRASQLPVVGGPFDFALGALTAIPDLYPIRDLSAPTLAVRYLARQARRGLGRGLVERLRDAGRGPADHVLRPGGAGRHRRRRSHLLRGHRRRREPDLGAARRRAHPHPLPGAWHRGRPAGCARTGCRPCRSR